MTISEMMYGFREIKPNTISNQNGPPEEIDWNFVLGLFFGIGYLIFVSTP